MSLVHNGTPNTLKGFENPRKFLEKTHINPLDSRVDSRVYLKSIT